MKQIISLGDSGGDWLCIDAPEENDRVYWRLSGAVCNIRIGKDGVFSPDAKQLTEITNILCRVSAGLCAAKEDAATTAKATPSLAWQTICPGILRAAVSEYSLVVRPSWEHSSKYIGFVNAPGQACIDAGDNYTTAEEAQAATVAALRGHLKTMRGRIVAAEKTLDVCCEEPHVQTTEWQSTGGTAWLSIGSFRIVLRLELNGSCTGWIDRNYTQITDAQVFDTWEAGKVVMMQSLRDYIANEVRELGQVATSLGGST